MKKMGFAILLGISLLVGSFSFQAIKAAPQDASLAQQNSGSSIFLPFVAKSLSASTLTIEGSIGGKIRTFDIADKYAYLGEGINLSILDISGSANPTLVGQYTYKQPVLITDIAVVGSIAYVATNASFDAISIANPNTPSLLSSVALTDPVSILVVGSTAYIAASNRIAVVDISDPQAMQLQNERSIPVHANRLQASNKLIFAFNESGPTNLIDIDTGAVLSTVSPSPFSYGNPPTETHYAYSNGAIQGTSAFLSYGESYTTADQASLITPSVGPGPVPPIAPDGFDLIDLSNPNLPTRTRAITVSNNGESSWEIAIEGTTLYLPSGSSLHRFDISDPNNPKALTSYPLNSAISKLRISNQRLYAIEGGDFVIRDLTTATSNPPIIGKYTEDIVYGGLVAIGDRLYTSTSIYDISTLNQPQQIATMPVATATDQFVISDTLRFSSINSSNQYNLLIDDLSNPLDISRVVSTTLNGLSNDIDTAKSYVFVSSSTGLQVIDVSDPSSPALAKTIQSESSILQTEIEGSFAYLLDDKRTLRIYNISDPLNANQLGSLILPASKNKLLVNDGYVYAYGQSGDDSGIIVIDVHQANAPKIAGQITKGSGPIEYLAVDGLQIFAASPATGELAIYERSIEGFAQLSGKYSFFGSLRGITFYNGYLYIIDANALYVAK
jgi:hypothetical protein